MFNCFIFPEVLRLIYKRRQKRPRFAKIRRSTGDRLDALHVIQSSPSQHYRND